MSRWQVPFRSNLTEPPTKRPGFLPELQGAFLWLTSAIHHRPLPKIVRINELAAEVHLDKGRVDSVSAPQLCWHRFGSSTPTPSKLIVAVGTTFQPGRHAGHTAKDQGSSALAKRKPLNVYRMSGVSLKR
jgi:hypothetical protein